MMNPEIDAFLDRFFSPPNVAWPDRSEEHRSFQALSKYLVALDHRTECPIVLPRRHVGWDAAAVYVICWDVAHAGRIRPLLDAAVAGAWAPFDGRVAHLQTIDPIDGAVLGLVGSGSTFVLRPSAQTSAPLFRALARLVRTLQASPTRDQTLPRPIGRVLRDFNSALSAGLSETSMRLLSEMEKSGGISLENLAFLQILRLSRLGQDVEVLTHPLFPVIARAEPPRLVKEALLGSWMRAYGPSNLGTSAGLSSAAKALRDEPPEVALLADASIGLATDEDALRLCGVVAVARADADLARSVLDCSLLDDPAERAAIIPDALMELLGDLSPTASVTVAEIVVEAGSADQQPPGETVSNVDPTDWIEWLLSLERGEGVALTLDVCEWWPPVATTDSRNAGIIDSTPLDANDLVLTMAPFVLDADDAATPPWRTSASLIRRYLLGDRLTPADLGAVSALLRVFLTAAPPTSEYRSLLEDLGGFVPRWLSVTNADVAIDMADLVVTSARPDATAAEAFATSLLSPLVQQRNRLSSLACAAAWMVTQDLNLDWEWKDERGQSPIDPVDGRQVTVLLYSLEDSVLFRVQEVLERTCGRVTVHASSAKRGSPMLRQQARNADLVVMATRRATHAATGFIAEHAVDAVIVYPDGSGSASMLRAVEDGMASLLASATP